ncbi:hypothetical protein CH337_20270 [Rhodoblastus acidophilus]|nr:hypothetical protein CKO16_18820 [Rhodoblastus acidophilus]RAI16652.1 hypothetical protein CH337_20270 [Rhodoblastus acidophilus]
MSRKLIRNERQMSHAFFFLLVSAIWIEAARILRAAEEEGVLMQGLVFLAGPFICLYIFVASCMSCFQELDDA